MERLTERTGEGQAIPRMDLKNNGHQRCMERLAEYEDLEEQGKLLRLPCKIGGTVYVIMNQRDNFSDALYKIVTAAFFRYNMIKDVGKTVFLTKKEAEEALESMLGL